MLDFTINVAILADLLKNITYISDKRHVNASNVAASHTKIYGQNGANSTVTFFGYAHQMSIKASAAASVSHNGMCGVPAAILYNIVKQLDQNATVRFLQSENYLKLLTVGTECRLPIIDGEDFPYFDFLSDIDVVSLHSKTFCELLSGVTYACSTDETRYYLKGVYLHTETIEDRKYMATVASDTFRLAKASLLIDNDTDFPNVIIPTSAALEVIRLTKGVNAQIKMGVCSNKVRFYIGDYELTTYVIEGKFPDYSKGIPKEYSHTIEINAALIKNAVNIVTSVCLGGVRFVSVVVKNNKIVLSSAGDQHFAAKQEIEINAVLGNAPQDTKVSFNARYFSEILNIITNDIIVMNFSAHNNSVVMHGKNDKAMHVIMPLKI
jgi:DNA polymerase-3 subunit beta